MEVGKDYKLILGTLLFVIPLNDNGSYYQKFFFTKVIVYSDPSKTGIKGAMDIGEYNKNTSTARTTFEKSQKGTLYSSPSSFTPPANNIFEQGKEYQQYNNNTGEKTLLIGSEKIYYQLFCDYKESNTQNNVVKHGLPTKISEITYKFGEPDYNEITYKLDSAKIAGQFTNFPPGFVKYGEEGDLNGGRKIKTQTKTKIKGKTKGQTKRSRKGKKTTKKRRKTQKKSRR